MANIKVRDLTDTSTIAVSNEIMVLTNDNQNLVQNITVENLLTNIISTDADNVVVQGSDSKLYVENPQNVTGDLENLTTTDKTSLVGAINEIDGIIGDLADLDTVNKSSVVNAINEIADIVEPTLDTINASKGMQTGDINDNATILADVVNYAHSTFDLSKFTVTGTPTITDDGIASGFSSSNYLTTPVSITNNIKIDCTFDYNNINSYQGIFYFNTSELRTMLVDNGTVGVYCSGSSLPLAYASKAALGNPQDNAKIRVVADITTSTSSVSIYVNNVLKYSLDKNGLSLNLTSSLLYIGKYFAQYLSSPIDLKQFSITVDGVEVFSGNKTGIDTIKPDDYTVVGTPTISADGILTTSTNNYVLTPSFNITNVEDFELVSPFFNFETQSSVFQQGLNWVDTNSLHINDTWFYIQRRNSTGNLEVGIVSQNTNVYSRSVVATDANTWYQIKFKYTYPNWFVYYRTKTTDWKQVNNSTITDTSKVTIQGTRPIAYKIQTNESLQYGQADLNGMQVYVDGNLVYQPCLKIPYTLSKTGSKIADVSVRPRVTDMYEQFGYAPYYTLDEANGNFTLPQGEIYGMINRLQENSNSEIGLPIATLSNTLNDNEIWLEGAEVSKTTYAKLYAVYGDNWGTPANNSNFVLPDFRNKTIWGVDANAGWGYISAGLPNITGNFVGGNQNGTCNGAFGNAGDTASTQEGSDYHEAQLNFDASRSSGIYGNSNTVQPPSTKVRFKTRFE